jgi:pimeloyl-ACP methyl ester carboxylesterase
MHFLGGNYMSYPITSFPGVQEWADSLGILVVMPHGRGEAGWYEGESEKDVFEVWRDVAQHYDIDRERVYLMGMSMGGFGTWRLGALYPDQFARTIVWSGPMTPYSIWPYPAPVTWPQPNPPMCQRDAAGCGYTLMDLFGNVRNLPYLVVHGGADELVPSTGAEHWMSEFDAEGSGYRYVLYPTRRHETSYPGSTAHFVKDWLIDLPARVRNPARVRYRIVRDFFQPEFGLTYHRAYWVRGLTLREDATEGDIDADAAQPHNVRVSTETFGLDDLGPYRMRQVRVSRDGPDGYAPNLQLRGISTATLDLARLGLDVSHGLHMHGSTDGPTELTLHGAFPERLALDCEETCRFLRRSGDDITLLVLQTPLGFDIRLQACDTDCLE